MTKIKTNLLSIGLILMSIFIIMLSLREVISDYIRWIGIISGFIIIGVEIAHLIERWK